VNKALAKALPKPPEGLAWEVGVSGDGTEGTVTIRLKDLFDPKKHLVATEYSLPKGSQPHSLVGLVAAEAKNLLLSWERYQVLQTLPGLYDFFEMEMDLEETA
jgi:hypothetical protein